MTDHPAIALIEYASIAVGTQASDAIVKKAPISLVRAGTLQPGKFDVLFSGEVAAVEESFVEGLRVGAESVIDRVLLPDVHHQVHSAILGKSLSWQADTIGVIETQTMSATIEAADAAVKGAEVQVVQIRLGSKRVAYQNQTVCTAGSPRIDDDLRGVLGKSTYFLEGR